MGPLDTGRERAAPDDRVELLPGQGAVFVRYREGRARPDARHCRHGRRHGDRLVVGSRLGRGHAAATGRGRRARRGPARGAPRRAVGGEDARGRRRRASRARRARHPRRLRVRLDELAGRGMEGRAPGPLRLQGLRAHAACGEGAPRRLPGPLYVRRARLRRKLVRPDVRERSARGPPVRAFRGPRLRRDPRNGRFARSRPQERAGVRPDVAGGGACGAGRRNDHELQRVARGDADRAGARRGRGIPVVRRCVGPPRQAGRALVPRPNGVLGRSAAKRRRRSAPARARRQ